MRPRDLCPRWFCSGTLRFVLQTREGPWRTRCDKCGRLTRLNHKFRSWFVRLGFVAWLLLVLWLPEAIT